MFKRSTGLQYAPEYAPEKINPNQLKGLISASYKRNGEARKIGSNQGYNLVDNFSNGEHKVFTDSKGNPYVAFTGSRKVGDWGTNAAIALGLGRFTKRFQDSKKLVENVRKQYGNKPITTIGHSLGGGLAEFAGNKADKVITLDKAIGIGGIGKNISRNQTDIRSGSDPVSVLNRFQFGGNKMTIRGTNFIDPIHAHDYRHLNKFDKTI
jgi:hypothetical protein